MKLSPRDQVIVAAVLIVVIAGGFFVLAILPQFGTVSDLESQIADVNTQITSADTLLKQRQDAKARAAETQVNLLDIASRFPEAPELPALIIELQDVANEIEIEFMTVVPSAPAPGADIPEISTLPVSLTTDGTWGQLIALLEELSSLRREVRIGNVSVSAVPPVEAAVADEGGETADATPDDVTAEDLEYTVNVSLSLVAYMMQPAQVGPAR